MMIALDAQAMLAEAGLDVEVAGTIADGLRMLAVDSFDAAVLDVNLAGETSFIVADELIERGLPFVFATGYGESIVMPDRFSTVRWCRNPMTVPPCAWRSAPSKPGRRPQEMRRSIDLGAWPRLKAVSSHPSSSTHLARRS